MAPEQTNNATSSLSPLIAGIVGDAQALIHQQLSLFQTEIKNDLRRTKEAAIPLAIGALLCLIAGFFVCLTVAHLITYLWPTCPQFAAYGIVGLLLLIIGGVLVFVGKTKFDVFNPLPVKAVEGLKENIQWTTKT